jgi:hypothetical protein
MKPKKNYLYSLLVFKNNEKREYKIEKPVIPAQAGIPFVHCSKGIPACAGMTPIFFSYYQNLFS